MQRVRESEKFFAAPSGRYLATDGMLYWCHDPRLWGITAWGTLSEHSARALSGWIDEEHRHPHSTYVTAVDLRRVTAVELDAFLRWQQWYAGNRERQRVRVERAAIVRPAQGIPAMLVAGIPAVLGPKIPWMVVDGLADALAWLDVSAPRDVAAALDGAYDETTAEPAALDALRAALDRTRGDPSVDALAASLGMSRRTLQRALQSAGTSFAVEVQSARVRRAQQMLLGGAHKLGAVALEVGFATQAHFSTVFRRVVGEPPSTWIARHAAVARPENRMARARK